MKLVCFMSDSTKNQVRNYIVVSAFRLRPRIGAEKNRTINTRLGKGQKFGVFAWSFKRYVENGVGWAKYDNLTKEANNQ